MQFDRLQPALARDTFDRGTTNPSRACFDAVFTIKPVALGAFLGERLHDILAQAAGEEVN